MLGNPKAFELGHTLESHTKGIWIGTSALTTKDRTGNEIVVLLIDCEGVDHVQNDPQGDVAIFVLSILMSEVLIFNTKGSVAQSDFKRLELFAKLSSVVAVDREDEANRFGELPKHFPHLLVWLELIVVFLN